MTDDPTDGDHLSWDERIDWALGQAGQVLTAVTPPMCVEDAVALSAEWRELAEAWRDRQIHVLDLNRAMCEDDLFDDELDEMEDAEA